MFATDPDSKCPSCSIRLTGTDIDNMCVGCHYAVQIINDHMQNMGAHVKTIEELELERKGLPK